MDYLEPSTGVTVTAAALMVQHRADVARHYGDYDAYLADCGTTAQQAFDAWLAIELEAGALVPVGEVVAQWSDSSGYYRVEVNPERTELRTYYSEDDTEPAVQALSRTALDLDKLEHETVGRFALDMQFMGLDFVAIDGVVYEVNPA